MLNQFNHVFWMGDLNYRYVAASVVEATRPADLPFPVFFLSSNFVRLRIDGLARTEVLRLIEKKEWDILIGKDQLRLEREAGNAFAGFREVRNSGRTGLSSINPAVANVEGVCLGRSGLPPHIQVSPRRRTLECRRVSRVHRREAKNSVVVRSCAVEEFTR